MVSKELIEKVCEACGWRSRKLSTGIVAIDDEGDMFAPWERIESAFIALEALRKRRPIISLWEIYSPPLELDSYMVRIRMVDLPFVLTTDRDLPTAVCRAIAEAWDQIKKE